MQLRFKKICLLSTIFIYGASFLLQSNFSFFQTWAKEKNEPRVNVVAILVDSKIYDGISSGLKWYASDYIQQQLTDTKALVIPLDLTNIHAYDIHRMMENVYFDGLKDVNSSLIGLIMVGDIPLPVVNQDGYIFPTVYPYVDFEDQKYVWDEDSKYFVPNGNPQGQAEIWHGLINYGLDSQAYLDFFDKIKSYVKNPDGFVGDSIWYDDFVAQKEGFLSENFPYYRNRIMFAEDLGYQRYSPLMQKIFRGEQTDNAISIISDLEDATDLDFSGMDILMEMNNQTPEDSHTTKMVQQEIQTSFISDYSNLFSQISSSIMRENIFAGGRWIKEYTSSDGEKKLIANSDTSASKIQIKDEILLGNDDMVGLIENLNNLMEDMIDKKIEEENFSMDIVVPVSYKKVTGKRVGFKRYYFVDRYENYYFGNDARLIDDVDELSIYRGTYRNLSDLSGVSYSSLSVGNNSTKSQYEKTDLKLKSIGGSYDIFSNQVEGNRGYTMMGVEDDLGVYYENRTRKDSKKKKKGFLGRVRKKTWPEVCGDEKKDDLCEFLYDFVKRWWGGASPINLDQNSVSKGRYELSGYLATDSWRPIFDMGGFQSLLKGDDEGMSGTGWIDGFGVGPQWAANSFKAYIKYASPTQRETWKKIKGGILPKYEYYENHTPDVHDKSFSGMDYFNLNKSIITGSSHWAMSIDTLSDKIFNISRPKSGRTMEQYSFKVISSVAKHKSTTDVQINGIDRNRYGEDGTLSFYYNDVKSAYNDLYISMSGALSTLSGLMQDINSGNVYISNKLVDLGEGVDKLSSNADDVDGLTGTMNDVLDDISELLDREHSNLSGFYYQLQGLYVGNIIGVMDSIIYIEGGDPDDYYETGNSKDLIKVGFLPDWLSDIRNIEGDITGNVSGVISYYDNVWAGINNQKSVWSGLYQKLENNSELDQSKISEISRKFEDMFWIERMEDDVSEEDDEHLSDGEGDSGAGNEEEDFSTISGFMLSGGTARILMSSFMDDLQDVDIVFSNLFEEDKIGPKIESEAKSDKTFRAWLIKNNIDYEDFDQSDWINQYAEWIKGPGYDSDGAKKNHDLLQGITEHVSGMNLLTPDRPIDSPRYVSMQSIAGNEIKFIYPDLFKVEVYVSKGKNKSGYDVHELLTGGQIKKNLEKYLLGKVDEYNTILQRECNNALNMDVYFYGLKDLGYGLATPEKGKHGCDVKFTYEEFVEALGGEKMLDIISETLYYQSLTNKKKLSAENIEEDIELVKKSFNVNDKRSQILKDYLTQGNEKIKNSLFEIPTYELSGYEVGFINSDGKDYIFTDGENAEDYSYTTETTSSNLLTNIDRQATPQEKNLSDKCKIPANGRLPLFKMDGTSPWLEGFKCRLEQTLESPAKLKLSFSNSLGDILASDYSLKDYIKDSDLSQNLVDWGDSMSKYVDDWDSLLNPGTGYDSDKELTQMQVNAEKHNQETVGGSDGLSNALSNVYKNVKISNTNVTLSDSVPGSKIKIESISDVGNLSVEFIGTGDGCIKLDSDVLCDGKTVKKIFNPKTNPFSGIVSSSDHVAGKVALIIKMNIGSGYLERVIKYTVSPSSLDHVDIKVGDQKTVAGMITPIEVIGYDKYGNKIDWGLEKYDFTASQGRFLKDGSYQSGFSANDFRNLKFYYQAPLEAIEGSVATIQIKSSSNGEVLKTYNQSIVQANPVIKLNGRVAIQGRENLEVNEIYNLKENEGIYVGGKLDFSKLQQLEIDIMDKNGKIVDVDSQILVSSQNGLVVVGQITRQENGDYVFSQTSKGYMKGGQAIVYFYPTTQAGEDIINIDIPGLDKRVIKLSIKPSSPSNVQFNITNGYLKLDKMANLEMFVSDIWGNSTGMMLNVKTDPKHVKLVGLTEVYRDDNMVISSINLKDGYAKIPVYGVGAGLTTIEAGLYSKEGFKVISDVDFRVDDDLLPDSGLNIMYLNYFGNDRGNQWGYLSENNKHIESLMKNSDKTIATTTLLASEDKIKKVLWKIDSGFKITNFDSLDTTLNIKSGKLNISVGGLSEMQVSTPSFEWVTSTLASINTLLNSKTTSKKNYIFFIPTNSEYSIKNGVLYDSNNSIASIMDGELTLQLSDQIFSNGDNVWNVIYKGENYGKIITHFPGLKPTVQNFKDPGNRYLVDNLFAEGSTDSMSSVGIFDGYSEFGLNSTYKSIQNSNEVDERIGFLGDFKNITLFAEGEIVGEATKKYGSELLINYGDPVLSRKDVNKKVYGTNYDGGIGEEIYTDPEKDIFGVYQIDFNNDGLKDWLVAYQDGSFKLAKSYGGNPDFRDMQELMRVAIRVKNVFVGDADGNGYQDIFVLTENNQIRVYLNNGGIFDVDGSVVCLNQNVFEGEISGTPSNLEGLNQFFVEDMDLDGVVDIVTYDEIGYIKVFYGGTTNGGPNYLSTEKYACDAGWYSRESNNITVVTALGIQISNDDIFDNSMIHWVGMSKPELEIAENDLSKYGVNFDTDALVNLVDPKKINSNGSISGGSIENAVNEIMSSDNFDIGVASSQFIQDEAKFVDVTLYENKLVDGGDSDNYVFAPSSFLDPKNPEDNCSVWKNYYVKNGGKLLMNKDIVTVRVTVKASDRGACIGAYGDIIQGPWNVYYDDNGKIKGIKFLQNQRNAEIKGKDGNFSYLIDNITLYSGEKMVFEYDLEYNQLPLRKMSVTYDTFWSNDKLPDIKLQSIDGCEKNFDGFINLGKRSFKDTIVDLQKLIDKEYENEDNDTVDYGSDVSSLDGDISTLPGMVGDRINRSSLLGNGNLQISDDENGRNILKDAIHEAGINLDVDLNIFQEQTEAIENAVDDITKGMCNGFSFGGSNNCKGLPVPFNQAFLAPGKYHLFGCRELPMGKLEGGVPAFFFPGNLGPTTFGYLPFPYAPIGPTDSFLWPKSGGGHRSSFIRIYAAPTLTAQLGIAVCMGPYSAGMALKSPWADIGGNCVVFAVKPQCKGGNDNTAKKKDKENPNEIYESFVNDVKDSGVCLQSQKGAQVTQKGYRSSPFDLYSYDVVSNQDDSSWKNFSLDETKNIIWGGEGKRYKNIYNNMDVNGGSNNQIEFETSFLGIINLETAAHIGVDGDSSNENNSFFVGDVDVLGGDFTVNKIRGGIQQGVRKMLIDKWLDPQIRYIANQLTKMHVNIKLPNISNLIENEIGTIQNVSESIGDDGGFTKVDDGLASKMKGWAYVNHDNLNKLNDSISNPFERLASLMNESNIVNISTQTLNVKVPMIFAEDINGYELYLHQWLDVNGKIVDEWKTALTAGLEACSKETDPEAKAICKARAEENLRAFVEFEKGDWQKMTDQIYANLTILQEYRNFPFEMYEWIHSIDRYMAEIASLINNVIGYLSYWTSTNAQRFVGYVDAIVLMLNIIKTYQLLIDFSSERGQSCGNCSKDTYDQYSCKLSILCDMIQLPIIQIPNFKLPNITIDLSNIDLSLDIVLPEFKFQPVNIQLPELPNLPEPPTVGVNIKLLDLPDIPLLPEPPELPELPSFIPEVEFELPILPPAPELPRLPNELESTIKIAKLIGKIYCIVKGKFGLVGESSVKAKIEQLTQRTYEVKWIDTIMDFTNRSAAPIHNYGMDYEIDSYVDLQFNFSEFYTYLDTLTKSLNNLTNNVTTSLNVQSDYINNNPLTDFKDSIDGASVDINMKVLGDGGLISKSDITIDGMLSNDIEYVDYESAESRLEEVLAYFEQETKDTTMSDMVKKSTNNIKNQINKENIINPNIEGMENLKNDVIKYLDQEKSDYADLAKLINEDYDGFLAMVNSNENKTDSETGKLLTFNVQLFNVDSSTKDTINTITKSNPYETILDNKKTIVDGYWNAINSNTANDLGLSQSQYLVLRDYIGSMRNQVTTLYSVTKPSSLTNLVAKNSVKTIDKTLVSSTAGGGRLGSNMEVANVVDPSVLSEGIYDKITTGLDKGKLVKIVYSDSFTSTIGDRYYHTSHTQGDNIVLWDDGSIYLKCIGGKCSDGVGGYRGYYASKVLKQIPHEETWITFDRETKLKIADGDLEVKNRKVTGQTYDTLNLSRDAEDVDAYLIKLVERVDNSYEKSDYKSVLPVRYVLAVPRGVTLDSLYSGNIKLELLKKTDKLSKIYGKDLVQVVNYDNNKDVVNVTISDIDRKWYYVRIATLNLDDNIYNINSPWSNQIVLGKQIVGDDKAPDGEAVLYRSSVDEIVSQGDNLEGYVGTKYKLIVNWKDNAALYYINLLKDGKILDEKYTSNVEDSVGVDIDIHTKSESEKYNAIGIDQFGNRTEKMITVDYSIPEIQITNISENSDGKTVSIVAELSQDIDTGNVSFQRKRGTVRKVLKRKGLEAVDFSVGPKQKLIVGGPYSVGNEVAMYDKNGDVIALMNPNTAEINLQSGYKNDFEISAEIKDGVMLRIYNKNTKSSVFSISIPTEKCLKTEADNYSIIDLSVSGKMGMFNGGKSIYKDGTNVLFISPSCYYYSELGLEGTYSYDRELDAVKLTLYQLSDLSKSNPIRLWFKVKSFVEK